MGACIFKSGSGQSLQSAQTGPGGRFLRALLTPSGRARGTTGLRWCPASKQGCYQPGRCLARAAVCAPPSPGNPDPGSSGPVGGLEGDKQGEQERRARGAEAEGAAVGALAPTKLRARPARPETGALRSWQGKRPGHTERGSGRCRGWQLKASSSWVEAKSLLGLP